MNRYIASLYNIPEIARLITVDVRKNDPSQCEVFAAAVKEYVCRRKRNVRSSNHAAVIDFDPGSSENNPRVVIKYSVYDSWDCFLHQSLSKQIIKVLTPDNAKKDDPKVRGIAALLYDIASDANVSDRLFRVYTADDKKTVDTVAGYILEGTPIGDVFPPHPDIEESPLFSTRSADECADIIMSYGWNGSFSKADLLSDTKKINRIIENATGIAERCPFYGSFVKDGSVQLKELLPILRSVIINRNGKWGIKPIYPEVMRRFEALSHLFCEKQDQYTTRDILVMFSGFAAEASKVNCADGRKCIDFSADFAGTAVAEHFSGWIEKRTDGYYRFSSKVYREIFYAVYLAENLEIHEIIRTLLDYSSIICRDLVKFTDDFDTIEVIAAGVLNALGAKDRVTFLNGLLGYAENFDVSQRRHQAQAISMLTFILWDSARLLTSEMRVRVFRATFGRTAYPIQIREWNNLKQHSDFYRKTVQLCVGQYGKRNNIPYFFFVADNSAFDNGDNGETAGRAPVFVNDRPAAAKENIDELLRAACVLRYETWENWENVDEKREEYISRAACLCGEFSVILSLIGKSENEKNSRIIVNCDDSIHRACIAFEAVLYAAANIVYNSSDPRAAAKEIYERLSKATAEAVAGRKTPSGRDVRVQTLSDLVLVSTYVIRAHSDDYDCWIRSIDNGTNETGKMPLILFGGIRFTSECGEQFSEKSELPAEYVRFFDDALDSCLKGKAYRYFILIARHLVCTSDYAEKSKTWPLERMKEVIPGMKQELTPAGVMEYDHIGIGGDGSAWFGEIDEKDHI